jgi:hypothetical protein
VDVGRLGADGRRPGRCGSPRVRGGVEPEPHDGTVQQSRHLGEDIRARGRGAQLLAPFRGGSQPAVRDDLGATRRETIDPDDYAGGFALWSGTSFAAPYVAGELLAHISPRIMGGALSLEERIDLLHEAESEVSARLAKAGPLTAR